MQRQKRERVKKWRKNDNNNNDTNNIKKTEIILRDQLLLIAVAKRPKWQSIL